MWKRATWHEIAEELSDVCQRFRDAYWGRCHGGRWPRHPDDVAEMEETSKEGVKLLRAVALAVRSEQDFDMAPNPTAVVGAIEERNATINDVHELKQNRGYIIALNTAGWTTLTLRQAHNKIAHANSDLADYYVGIGNLTHDLFLFGDKQGKMWLAAISIIELIKAIKALPDINLRE